MTARETERMAVSWRMAMKPCWEAASTSAKMPIGPETFEGTVRVEVIFMTRSPKAWTVKTASRLISWKDVEMAAGRESWTGVISKKVPTAMPVRWVAGSGVTWRVRV